MSECVASWVHKKFRANLKVSARNALWPNLTWQPILVHGRVKHPAELRLFDSHGITRVPLGTVLQDLCTGDSPPFTGSAGGDLADLIAFYAQHSRLGA
jgi:hypothetical protein